MKIKILILAILILKGLTFGQADTTYPLVTLSDINRGDTTGKMPPPWPPTLAGDTVRVRGTVTVSPVFNPIYNRTPVLYFASAWGGYVQEDDSSPWSGLNIYQADTTFKGTLFDLCDTAKTYEFTGIVSPYGASTELVLINKPIKLISSQTKRPDPIALIVDSCFDSHGLFNLNLRKYNDMYVQFVSDSAHPLITSDANSFGKTFRINDNNGHYIDMYGQSNFFRPPKYTFPPNGTYLSYIRGLLEGYQPGTGWIWEIIPLYPGDIGALPTPVPFIINVKRSPAIVGPNDPVAVTCAIYSTNGVQAATLFKRVNGGVVDSLPMRRVAGPAGDTLWGATIPNVSDSAFVDYYIEAWDNNNASSTSPSYLNNYHYSYFVLNRPLTIQDVRYSPFGSGISGYNGYKVKVSGIVISDTTDIPGNINNPGRIYIQNGAMPWSGLLVGRAGANSSQVLKLQRGDDVTIEGTVVFNSTTGTRIDTLTLITINSHNNPMPASHVMKTGDVGTSLLGVLSVEQWNGCQVTYKDVTIDSANADGANNYGESYCQDLSGGIHTRIDWSDGQTRFNAGPNAVRVNKGDKFGSITGMLGYTRSNYKLCPRKDADLVGPSDVRTDKEAIPTRYVLNQNYPNPFNPSTTISFSLAQAGNVKITVYNAIGSKVATVVNEYKSAGNYSVQFNGSNLASGIYLYRLESGNYNAAKKFIVLK